MRLCEILSIKSFINFLLLRTFLIRKFLIKSVFIPGMPTKQRTVKNFGYLEDQENPEEFMAMVKQFNNNYKADNVPLRIEALGTAKMYSKENRRQNYGYKFLETVYGLLDMSSFIQEYEKRKKFRGNYSLDDIFKFLVLARILHANSKRATCQLKNGFYGMRTDFTLTEVYRAFDHFADFEVELQRYLNERIKETIGCDLSYAFYDVTNYYFEIGFPRDEGDLRKRGVSKEHRVDPIVALGLFMDSNGSPVNMSIFPGNTSNSITLQLTMKDIKESYGLGRIVVVADKGFNSSKNIDEIINNGDGFVFSQIVKGKKGQCYNEQLFDDNNWVSNKEGTYQYKLFEEEYVGKDKDGNKKTRTSKIYIIEWTL